MDRENLTALLALTESDGLGSRRILELVKLFGSPAEVVQAPAGEIASALNQKTPALGRAVRAVMSKREALEKRLAAAEQAGIAIVTHWDEGFPERLKRIPDPPVMLYKKGMDSPLFNYAVAVVGTRAASDHGSRIAFNIGRDFAAAGVAVVSGMALGIDARAHEGALAAGGRTIAVLGCGVDVIYPPSNRSLYQRIAASGAILSESPPGTEPEAFHFPRRNRIISGLSLGVVVVEAGLKSGALITAKHSLEQGREVFAVPGLAGSLRGAGVNRLIKDGGAHMVESAAEVLEHLKSQLAPVTNVRAAMALPDLKGDEAKLYQMLEAGPMLVDEVIAKSELGAVEINRLLTTMQLKGLIRRIPGGQVGRV